MTREEYNRMFPNDCAQCLGCTHQRISITGIRCDANERPDTCQNYDPKDEVEE